MLFFPDNQTEIDARQAKVIQELAEIEDKLKTNDSNKIKPLLQEQDCFPNVIVTGPIEEVDRFWLNIAKIYVDRRKEFERLFRDLCSSNQPTKLLDCNSAIGDFCLEIRKRIIKEAHGTNLILTQRREQQSDRIGDKPEYYEVPFDLNNKLDDEDSI